MRKSENRKAIPTAVETNVLRQSARRCPLCYCLDSDLTEKMGQIAHLDQKRDNAVEDNLVWMCWEHHTKFDSKTSQHKNYTLSEVKSMRDELYKAIVAGEHNKIAYDGGKGGNAKVEGNGIAIGGPGGRGGKCAKGGNGGDAEVNGDGIAVGGAAGSVDSDVLWIPPARSGYEILMETLGQPIDLIFRQYGRGGMSSGYAMRHDIAKKICVVYLENNNKDANLIHDIMAVPLDYVNQRLSEMGFNWCARIVKLDYEFYIPS